MDSSSPLRRWIGRPETAHHNSERCRALLRRLLRDVAAFARQQQQRHPASATPDATLWIRAIERVCNTRLEQLEDNAVASSPTRPEDVVAEAMVQGLLVSLASIRVAETEALVLDHVEDVESLRRLSITLQRDDAALRRAVRDGAGDDAQLDEVQRLVRDAFVQELAQERAQGLADSLHHEASLQFAWETIHEQKQEIVRLRAAIEARAEPPDTAEEPLHAIQQLQLQLSSHPDTRLRVLEAQLSHLEVAMGHRDARVVPSRLFTSGVTLSSSRDDVDDESMRGSVLLPSHLTTPEPAVRECAQCRRHVRAAVECQSENKQLRAQAAADEDALVRAEQVQAHMKKEHTALTSALMTAKQKQEELRQMILEITDEKLRIQELGEAQQRKHNQQVETLQRQVQELEQWCERSDRQRLDSLACEEATNTELSRLKKCHETIERERDALAKRVEDLERQVHDAKAEATVEAAKAVEALNALVACDTETRSTKQRLQQTLEQVTRHETTIELFRQKEQQQLEAERSASRQITHLRQQLELEAAKAAKHSEVATKKSARLSELTRELSTRDEHIRELLKDTANQQAAQQMLTQHVQSRRAEQQRLEQLVAELDGRLNQSEETRSELQNAVEQALARVKTLETAAQTSTQELQQAYEDCHRLELSLADARAETSNLQTRLLEKEQVAESEVHHKAQLNGVVTSSKEQIQCLTTELAETKTTILMWMSKYHTAVHAKDKLEEQLRSLQEDLATSAMEQDSAMERFRQEYHTLAEDKERVLQELASSMEAERSLMREAEDVRAANVTLQKQTDTVERELRVVSEELRSVTVEKDGLALQIVNQLRELDEVRAQKNVLVNELCTAQVRYQEVLAEQEAAERQRCRAVKDVERAVCLMLANHEGSFVALLDAITSSVEALDRRLNQVHRRVRGVRRAREVGQLVPPAQLREQSGSTPGRERLVAMACDMRPQEKITKCSDIRAAVEAPQSSANNAPSDRVVELRDTECIVSSGAESLRNPLLNEMTAPSMSQVDEVVITNCISSGNTKDPPVLVHVGVGMRRCTKSSAIETQDVESLDESTVLPVVVDDTNQEGSELRYTANTLERGVLHGLECHLAEKTRATQQQELNLRLIPQLDVRAQAEAMVVKVSSREAVLEQQVKSLCESVRVAQENCVQLEAIVREREEELKIVKRYAESADEKLQCFETKEAQLVKEVRAIREQNERYKSEMALLAQHVEQRKQPQHELGIELEVRRPLLQEQESTTISNTSLCSESAQRGHHIVDTRRKDLEEEVAGLREWNERYKNEIARLQQVIQEQNPSRDGDRFDRSLHGRQSAVDSTVGNLTEQRDDGDKITTSDFSDDGDACAAVEMNGSGPKHDLRSRRELYLAASATSRTHDEPITSILIPESRRDDDRAFVLSDIETVEARRSLAQTLPESLAVPTANPTRSAWTEVEARSDQDVVSDVPDAVMLRHNGKIRTRDESHVNGDAICDAIGVLSSPTRCSDVMHSFDRLHQFHMHVSGEWLWLEKRVAEVNERLCRVAHKASRAADLHRKTRLQPSGCTQTTSAGDRNCDVALLTGEKELDDSTRRELLNQSWTTQHSEVAADRGSAILTTQGFAVSRGKRPAALYSQAKTSGTRRASVVHSRDGHSSLRVVVNRRTVTLRLKPSSRRAARSGDYRDGNSPSIHRYEQIGCDCRAAKVLLLWSKIVQNMKARSARVRMMETFSQYRQVALRAARICSRFKMLTTKLLATTTSRALLTIAATNVRRIVTETIASQRDVRQHRAMAAWARVLRKMTAKRSPLLITVKSLLHELRHRRDPHEFASRWQVLAWRFGCLQLRRDLWRISLQCVCVQQKFAQQHSLKVQFETMSQENSQQVNQFERPVMAPERPVASHQIATVSTDLQVAMQECVSLLRACYTNQTAYVNDHYTGNGQIGARMEPAAHDIVDTAEWARFVNLDRLIQLLLEGSKQAGEWKEAMDRKLHEISVREGQLRRLETHCTELQRIIETYHQVRHRRDQTTLVGADDQQRRWLSPDHLVQGAGQSTCVDPRSRSLEKERRRLNQGTIEMLERVIAQLQEARDARLQLHNRLDLKTRSLENAQRYCRSVCIENLLLRAFYRWRLHTVFPSAA